MQKVKLDRIGEKPTIVEVPDDCIRVIDMTAELKFEKMYDTLSKRYRRPRAIYFKFWEKENGKWVLHNEPLEELIRVGYLDHKELQPSISKAKTEGVYELKKKQTKLSS